MKTHPQHAAWLALIFAWHPPILSGHERNRRAGSTAAPSQGLLRKLPAAEQPRRVGIRLVRNLLARKHFALDHGFSYMESCAGYAAVRFAHALPDAKLLAAVERRYQVIVTPAGRKYRPAPRQVDASVFGLLPLEMDQIQPRPAFRRLGLSYARAQWNHPIAGRLSPETKYYLDAAYKLSVVQAHAWQVTHRARYARRSVRELLLYVRQFQRPDGLFWHGRRAHIEWGRGDGWMASAMTEVLADLPADTAGYGQIRTSYRKMMAGLVRDQARDGMWRQVVNDPQAWKESSATGMFTYALAAGLRHGWIHGWPYRRAVRRGWRALCRHLDGRANVRDVCILTEHANTTAYYLSRPKQTGNLHGQFSMLWAARELLPARTH